jgi:splicing suppressor protein 51
MDDFEVHLEVCETIKQINEDDHDLRSRRFFPEFNYPGPQDDDFVVNMANWDTLLYSRQFEAINHDRSMRQVTRMLTYPITVASVLHELSPYNIHKGGRLTPEGLKSLSGQYPYQCKYPLCSHLSDQPRHSAPLHPSSSSGW